MIEGEPDRRPRRWRRLAMVIGGLGLLGSMPWWGPRVLAEMSYFRLRRVQVVGARYVRADSIVALLGVDTTRSIWDETDELVARVRKHPQVSDVEIARRVPGTLVVTITERVPVAFVPTARGLEPLDAAGRALPIDPSRVNVDLPVLARRDTGVLRLLGELRERSPQLYERVSAARRVGRREILLELGSINVRAMEDVGVDRLGDILPVEADLARRHARAVELDLRYRDQVIARVQ
ncbi:MAG TPA: FtsQ-type POTRA domain-containing protein [Gemmatimonadaceae bacterium]|nr:FtsQ-type POTRA domain-containing protein [Gemmatimonadaceae bacterium]